jgi:hypothetical protein
MSSAPPRPLLRARFPAWLAPLALTFAVALVYANSLSAPFLFDDAGAVLGNPTIRSLTSLAVLNPPADGSTTTGRPLVNLSYALNYALGGDRVLGYRVVNVAIHALAALTLFGLLRRTFLVVRGKIPLAGDEARDRDGAIGVLRLDELGELRRLDHDALGDVERCARRQGHLPERALAGVVIAREHALAVRPVRRLRRTVDRRAAQATPRHTWIASSSTS